MIKTPGDGRLFYVRSASRHISPEYCFNHYLCECVHIEPDVYVLKGSRMTSWSPLGVDFGDGTNDAMIHLRDRPSETIIIPTIAIAFISEVVKPRCWT